MATPCSLTGLVVRPSLRPVPFAIAIALAWGMHRSEGIDDRAANRSTALCEALARRALKCDADDVTWLSGARGIRGATFGEARALVRAESPGEPTDLYLVDARLSPEGMLLAVDDDYDVTKTSGVAEGKPIVRGDLVAYTTSVDGIVTAIHSLDLSGKPASFTADFTKLQNWQIGLTNLQQTGSRAGILHNAFSLDPPANQVDLSFSNSANGAAISATADGRAMLLDPKSGSAIEGGGWVRSVPDTQARPGNLLTWSVDRVRAMPWFGEEKMQVVKAVAFTALDFVLRARSKVFGDSTAADVAQDLAGLGGAREPFTDPEIGWPPAPLTPLVKPALAGEGKWIVLDHDPFITDIPGTPSAFVTTFVRADKARLNTRVYVTMWDPRQIALHMEAGTVEPVSATGEAGPGVVPRTPEVLKGLVAGFNGGFQAVHGEYGMQANGVLYLPPKPYAATVLELRDGTTAFGAWPANTDVPDDVLSFRQNLTALVQDEQFNPWKRTWWGGTPKGWHDEIHTTRSGICMTKENFVGYFWGNDISADVLAEGMILARCAFGIHLDMNPGLAGFEFYNVQNASNFQPLGRPIQPDWEYEGSFKDLPDFRVRARRMIKGMSHMNFPQYIHRDARDFFYLTRRPELPGADLVSPISPPEAGEGQWRVKGLPQHGFPYALATTEIRVDAKHPDLRARIVRVDPRTVRPAASAGTSAETPTIISFTNVTRFKPGEIALVRGAEAFFIGDAPPENTTTLAVGYALGDPRVAGAHAFAGVQDDDGMLVWIELADNAHVDDTTNALVDALLQKMGCSSRVALASGTRALLGGDLDLAAAPTPAPTTPVARLVRGDAPSGHLYFTDTPIVGPNVWQPLQMQRVRYFHHPDKKDAGAPEPASSASPASSN